MKKIFAVAKWEYLQKVRTKTFLIGLLLTPILMIGMGILPTFFASQEDTETRIIGIVDHSGQQLAIPLAERLQSKYKLSNGLPHYLTRVLASGKDISLADAVESASQMVANDELTGVCIIKGPLSTDSVVEYRSKSVGDFQLVGRLTETLRNIVSEKRVQELGLDPRVLQQLEFGLDVESVKLSKQGEKEEGQFFTVFISAYVFLMMLFLLIITSGQMLVRSVIEEKSSRIVEILVSSCSPTELMAGKVIGLSGIGFTQMAFWALIGVAAALQFNMVVVRPEQAALLVIYFILGYLFYAGVFIGAGSPLNTEQEAQQVTSYLVIVLIIPLTLALPAMRNPDATWIKVMSYIPLLTPTMMALRIPIQMPSTTEILTTIALMIVSIYFVMVAAGRIFRIGILSTGKSPKLGQVLRWARGG
jgi:ABC-2 type transport system permease protein